MVFEYEAATTNGRDSTEHTETTFPLSTKKPQPPVESGSALIIHGQCLVERLALAQSVRGPAAVTSLGKPLPRTMPAHINDERWTCSISMECRISVEHVAQEMSD